MDLNWGYYHPICRCVYGTLTRTNDSWLASSQNKQDCITDHKINLESTKLINMLPTPLAAVNSYDLLPNSYASAGHLIKYFTHILPFIGFCKPRAYTKTSSLVTEVNHRYMLENLRPSTEEKIPVIHWATMPCVVDLRFPHDCYQQKRLQKNNFICWMLHFFSSIRDAFHVELIWSSESIVEFFWDENFLPFLKLLFLKNNPPFLLTDLRVNSKLTLKSRLIKSLSN